VISGHLGLAVALGCGLLIGLERERRKREGPDREAAGVRTFTLAALGGALAQTLAQPLLVLAGALSIIVLTGLAYARSQRAAGDGDPGLTTELALFVTYLVGVLAVLDPPLGAAAGVVVAMLLAARQRLHRFATQALSEAELHDALLLAALALVLLPLLPATPVAWLGGLQPRSLVWLLVLMLALQAAGHIALRLLGARAGLAISGLFSGFVSSTATVAAMGTRATAKPTSRGACAAGAMLSSAATWVQAELLLLSLAPAAAASMLPAAATGVLIAAATAGWSSRAARSAGAPPAAAAPADPGRGPLRVREAAIVAALLTVVTLAVGWAGQHFGSSGVLAGSMLSALADAHAAIAALGSLQASGRIDLATLQLGVLGVVATNSASRSVVAFVAGGTGYGLRVTASLALSSTAAAAVTWALR